MSRITENTKISELLEMIGIKVEGEPTRATISLEVGCMPKMWVEFVEDGGLTIKTIDTVLAFQDPEGEPTKSPEVSMPVATEPSPELLATFAEACRSLVIAEGDCFSATHGILCANCPGNAEYNGGVHCVQNGWTENSNAGVLASAKQWLKENGESE